MIAQSTTTDRNDGECQDKTEADINSCSERCLKRIRRAERFSWLFTTLMHRFSDDGAIVSQ